jgi:SAM-dependent methyltransferase
VSERYRETAVHFDVERLPVLLERTLPLGPLAFADVGCGDGPHFAALARDGYIDASRSVYAVDLEEVRLARVSARFPWITTIVASAESVPGIPDASLDAAMSTMVMEHVPDEARYLAELRRVLKPGARAYVTTVYKKRWAWYFRKRNGESVLDTSHLREYTDVDVVRALVGEAGLRIVELETRPLWFPLLDPLLFRVARGPAGRRRRVVRALRAVRVPIPGYYTLAFVVQRP